MTAPDKILIRDLELRAIVGVNEWERTKKQDLVLNLVLYSDLRASARSDDVGDTLHYGTLTKAVSAYVEASEYRLIETLATGVARLCVEHGADRVRVRVDKPWAVRHAAAAAVEIERERSDFE